MTFYLKYRPKTLEELDLASVRERLLQIVKSKKFSHAYIFSGPRGTGKTSTARILAREMGAVGIDVIEMDAASNRGIDDIRELRERVGLSPAEGQKKAYIIDEVHMLTTEAFNALLKTLEEPPDHVVFFLCTTGIEKVPETIVSRCVSIPFQKATSEEIVRSLTRTAKGEKLSVEKGALELITTSVDGSFREAQTILEEASSTEKVTIAGVEKAMGGSFIQLTTQYVHAVESGDVQAALQAVSVAVEKGGNIGIFSRHILQEIRKRLLGDTGNERLLLVAETLEERVRTIQYAPLPELSLEIAAIELQIPGSSRVEGQQAKKWSSRAEERSDVPKSRDLATEGSDKNKDASLDPSTPRRPASTQRGELVAQDDNDAKSVPSLPAFSLEQFLSKWPAILSGVREKNHGIVTLLSHCRPTRIEGNTLVVEVGYKFHKDQLTQDRYRHIIEGVTSEVCGMPLFISFIIGTKTQDALKKFPKDDNIQAVDDSELLQVAEELFTT